VHSELLTLKTSRVCWRQTTTANIRGSLIFITRIGATDRTLSLSCPSLVNQPHRVGMLGEINNACRALALFFYFYLVTPHQPPSPLSLPFQSFRLAICVCVFFLSLFVLWPFSSLVRTLITTSIITILALQPSWFLSLYSTHPPLYLVSNSGGARN